MTEFYLYEALLMLLITILIESFVLIMMLRSPVRAVLIALAINIVSWPVGSFLYYVGDAPWILSEVAVVMIETALLGRLLKGKRDVALLASIAINIPSAIIGIILSYV